MKHTETMEGEVPYKMCMYDYYICRFKIGEWRIAYRILLNST
jgi:hypothetical protein